MNRVLKLRPALVAAPLYALLLAASLASLHPIAAQRSRLVTPPQRDLEGMPVLPAGTQTIPQTMVLILEMETRLESNRSRVSDRFQATVATPVIDASGRTLVPQGAVVEGHVTSVQPAKWRSRSGTIGITFDYILLDGRRTPIRGFLTPADERTRRQMDQEGNLKGSSTIKRTFLFLGGGAGAGATVAAVTSAGILAATGIGAAAGLTTSLLWKGQEAVVVEGQRFGLELTSPLRVGPPWYQGSGRQTSTLPVRSRTGPLTRPIIPDSDLGRTPSLRPTTPQGPSEFGPNAIRTSVRSVPVYDARAERTGDGYLRVLINSETPTADWRIYTHHELTNNNSTLEIRLRGWPPASYGYPQVSHPPAPTIIVQDRNGIISRILVHGSNGSHNVAIQGYTGGIGYTEPPRQVTPTPTEPFRPRANDFPADGSPSLSPPLFSTPTNPPADRPSNTPSSGGLPDNTPTTLSDMANRVLNQLEVFRENFAPTIGLWRTGRGGYEALGPRRPTANEQNLLEDVGFMIESVRQLADPRVSTQQRRASAGRLRDDFQVANQLWARVSLSRELNTQWRAIQQSVQNLINVSYR